MKNVAGKVVAISGASSGIGEAAARLLADQGAQVVLGARRVDRLEGIASDIEARGGEACFAQLDVTSKSSFQNFVQRAIDRFGQLDVLVNNAGVMPVSYLIENKTDEWEQMVDVNIKGVLFGISAALPIFTRRQSGQFINITSVADRVVSPASSVYCGTKFAVRAISDGLRQEVGKNIRVTVVAPGATATELTHTITTKDIRQAIEEKFFGEAMSPFVIAEAISYAIRQPDTVDVSELVVRTADSPA